MSTFEEIETEKVTRRDFLAKSTTLAGFCLLNCEVLAQSQTSKIVRALDDEKVVGETVKFESGLGEIEAYISRPKKNGRFPVVIVVSGSTFDDEYIQNYTAMFAQQGFVGISPNIFSLQKPTMTLDEKRKIFVEQITDERIFQDLLAAIDYLQKQDFVDTKHIGITGFCFGGRCALMFATRSREIDAVVPFYGNLRTPVFANRKQDPLDVLDKIRVPVQGHYSKTDAEIPPEHLKTFEDALKKSGTKVEIFTYDAPHGFFSYNRTTYNAEAARLSFDRTAKFFQQYLK